MNWSGIQLFPLFQRIVKLNNPSLDFAYEATIRGRVPGKVYNPAQLFRRAELNNELLILDNRARSIAIQRSDALGNEASLFLNCHGVSLEKGKIFEELDNINIPFNRIVLEITEQTRIENIGFIKQELSYLREKGMKIALDDFGAGFSNFYLVEALSPDYIKLDKSIIAHVEFNKQARAVVEGMVAFAEKAHTQLIAEGIETKGQKHVVQEMGIEIGQGFYFGYPSEYHKLRVSSLR